MATPKRKTADPAEAEREQALKALTTARKVLAEREQANTANEASIRRAREGWANGDGTVSGAELGAMEADRERFEALIRAAHVAVTDAEDEVKLLEPVLAERVAQALGDELKDTAALVAREVPTEPSAECQVLVIERRGRTDHDDGTVSGEVDVIVVGPDGRERIDPAKVTRALEQRHLGKVAVEEHDGLVLRLSIGRALPGGSVPVIPEVDKSRAAHVAHWHLSGDLADRLITRGHSTCWAQVCSEMIGESIDDSTRRVEVAVTLTATTGRTHFVGGFDPKRAAREAEHLLRDAFRLGDGIVGLGVVEHFDVESEQGKTEPDALGDRSQRVTTTARVVLISHVAE